MNISLIIPVFNEEKVITNCLESLAKQTAKDKEIICVDDGSTDHTTREIENCKLKIENLILLRQNHLGPGAARNLGAKEASSSILVFVDADMEFAPDFLEKLTASIIAGQTIGTFSKEEYLLNSSNIWARLWNLNLGRRPDKMHPDNYPDVQNVFRAILKSKFAEAGGFDTKIGYTDDWTLSRKLGVLATAAAGAKYYHRNPDSLPEVWTQARWFGKNEFLTGNLVRKVYNLLRYNPLLAIAKGVVGAIKFHQIQYLIFKEVFDSAVFVSVLLSFFGENKNK